MANPIGRGIGPRPLKRKYLPPGTGVLALALMGFLLIGPNAEITLLSIAVLLLGASITWRPAETPILLLAFLYQWLQIFVGVFHADISGIKLSDYSPVGGDLPYAVWLSAGGLTSLALGIRAGFIGILSNVSDRARYVSQLMTRQQLIRLYFIGVAIGLTGNISAVLIPPLSQPFLALASLKWAFYFMLVYGCFVRRAGERVWMYAFLFEMLQSIGGFFADFRTPIMFTFLPLMAATNRIRPITYVWLTIGLALTLSLAVVWTSVKPEYRAFINSDSGSQQIDASYSERMIKLLNLVLDLDGHKLEAGLEDFIHRLSYIEFFGVATNFVPSIIPHENGAIYLDAITRPLMPRVLFPDKAVIDDSERTNMYTGGAAGPSGGGTSISLGYIAEAYIDFGVPVMMLVLFVLGWVYGLIYKVLVTSARFGGLWGMATASCVLYPSVPLESSFTKVFGGVATGLIVVLFLNSAILPRVSRAIFGQPL
ncbi:hypothetical protein [Methylocystis echinoides]|uniref:hypothetical protein n=1 Tax=Methylocystis echinoides TaxID=29468 RepID=UPI00249005C3|nr:hypothetical protein [Methylocystis echinoides]